MLLLLYAALAAGTVILQLVFGDPISDLFLRAPLPHFPALDVGLGVALGLLVVLLGRPLDRIGPSARLNRFLRELLSGMQPREALAIAGLGSFAEELLFRGFLQPHLGLIATSVIFGAVHYVPRRNDLLLWPFAAMLMGLVFGGLALVTGGILAPTVAHFTINYFNLHLLLARET